jgi:acyl-CoA synthetase (AMP-forming)/AMP-acid ligase II
MSVSNLVEFLRERARRWPDRHAFTYLEDGVVATDSLDFATLEVRARALAFRLGSLGNPGERSLLLFPAGLHFLTGFFGCLFAGVLGISTPPPEASRLKRTGPRLRAIVDNAEATLVVTTT